jgi:tripartite-type tricarboxylate transporter receptor subunit TctC
MKNPCSTCRLTDRNWRPVSRSSRFYSAVVTTLLLIYLVWPAVSQAATDYPNRPVRVVIPFSAGGAPDIAFRLVAIALSEKWKQPVIVENRPGGNTFIGTTAVVRSAPDGYTLLFTADGTFILNPLLYASLPYAMNELVPITLVATTPHVLVVSNNVKARNVQDFIALAKANPDKMTYGSTGPGSIQRLAFESFSQITGIRLVHVPYRGANETTTALVAGEIDAAINGIATVAPQLAASNIQALAITTKSRSPLMPNLPTLEEQGVTGFTSQGAFGLLAPKGVSQEILVKIEADIVEILHRPEMRAAFHLRYFDLPPFGHAEFENFIAEGTKQWRPIIQDKNIKLD